MNDQEIDQLRVLLLTERLVVNDDAMEGGRADTFKEVMSLQADPHNRSETEAPAGPFAYFKPTGWYYSDLRELNKADFMILRSIP